jgi:beta-lactamase regulating signal transducer with metallopeptidase domain
MDIRISQYILESGIGLLVFYGIYYFLLRKETFFQLNRAYLLLTALASILIPLAHVSLPAVEVMSGPTTVEETFIEPTYLPELVQQWHDTAPVVWEPLEAVQPAPGFTFGQLLWLVYSIGIAVMSFRFFQKFSVLNRLIRTAKKSRKKGYTLVTTKNVQAASFLGYLFWNEEQAEDEMILQHELVHIRQRHSLDVLLMEALVILLWFNPLVYWYRKAVKEVHEYIADYEVARKHSPYAYACLLVQSQKNKLEPPLFNTFHSFIKKRLLMLHNQPSSNWRLMKYLITMPILAALIIFFTLDFSDKLPEQITKPFEKANQYVDNVLDEVVVVGYPSDSNMKGLESTQPTTYQIRWEGKTCNCYPEKEEVPNYFFCEGISITKSRLAQSDPFELLKNGEPMPIHHLWARTNSSFEQEQGAVSMEELDHYEAGRSFFEAVPIGYTIRFNFDIGKEAGFYFHAFVNNEQNSLQLTHIAQIGDQKVNIDPMIREGSLQLDFETYQSILGQPILLRMQDGIAQAAVAMRVDVGSRYSAVLDNKPLYRLEDFASSRWIASPGDRVKIHYYLDEDETEEYTITLNIEPDEEWHRRPREHVIFWDGKAILDPVSIFLEPEQLDLYNGKKMEFVVNSKKYGGKQIKHIGAVSPDFVNGPKKNTYTQYPNIPGHRFQEMLDRGMEYLRSGGDRFSFVDLELENGLIYKHIRIFRIYDFDPASWYKDPQQASYDKDRRIIRLHNLRNLDVNKLGALRMSSGYGPILIVNGQYISSSKYSTIVLDVLDQLQLTENDEVTVYMPGTYPEDAPIKVPVGYIDIKKQGFDVSEYRTNVITSE